jgi:multiple sugar transport system ATP-binding protein
VEAFAVAQVVIENLYKSFPRQGRAQRPAAATSLPEDTPSAPAQAILKRINLTINDGEFMVLVGPSGCGKSTLLRLISGLESITGGNIWVGEHLVNELPPKARNIAMVFQSYALYPHLSVYDNLAFGLRRTPNPDLPTSQWWQALARTLTRPLPAGLHYFSQSDQRIDQIVRNVAQMLQIDDFLHRLPKQLSGGQKQRVALGRAMARDPQVFLMDEPLSNLDAKLRTETRAQIVNLQRKLGTTTIYVTHDQTEAMTMGDRIAVMNQGQIQQIASPLELYHKPANRFVAGFIGSPPMNFLSVQVQAPLTLIHPSFRLTLPSEWETALAAYHGQTLTLGIRPEHLRLSVPAPKNLPVTIQRIEALGSETYLTLSLEGAPLQVRLESDQPFQIGDRLDLALQPERIHLFDAHTEAAIQP